MKLNIIFISATLLISTNAFAYEDYNYNNNINTHYVDGYTRSNGTYVEGHEAGNPGSGVHCHHNICE